MSNAMTGKDTRSTDRKVWGFDVDIKEQGDGTYTWSAQVGPTRVGGSHFGGYLVALRAAELELRLYAM